MLNKFPKTMLLVVLPLLLLVLLWMLRFPLTAAIAQAYDVRLQCQQWTLVGLPGRPALHVEALCIQHDSAEIEIRHAVFDIVAEHLVADSIVVNVPQSDMAAEEPSSDSIGVPDWQLPAGVPSGDLKSVSINAEELSVPINVALRWDSLAAVAISGDIQGSVGLTEDQINADWQWRAEQLAVLLGQDVLLTGDLHSHVELTRDKIHVRQQLDISGNIPLAQCLLQLQAKGELRLAFTVEQQALAKAKLALPLMAAELSRDDNCQLPGALSHLSLGDSRFKPAAVKTIRLDQGEVQADVQSASIKAWSLHLDDSAKLQLQSATINRNDGNFTFDIMLSNSEESIAQMTAKGNINPAGFTVPGSLEQLIQQLDVPELSLRLNEVQYQDVNLKNTVINAAIKRDAGLSGVVNIAKLTQQKNMMRGFELTVDAQINDEVLAAINTRIDEVVGYGLQLQEIRQQFAVTAHPDFLASELSGDTFISRLLYEEINIPAASIKHKVNVENKGVRAGHVLQLQDSAAMAITHTLENAQLSIAPQAVSKLNAIIEQVDKNVFAEAGVFSAEMQVDFASGRADGKFSIDEADLLYQDYRVDNLHFASDIALSEKGVLASNNGEMTIEQVFVGIDIANISAALSKTEPFRLQAIKGNTLGGYFEMDSFLLSNQTQETVLRLYDLDAEQLLELEKQSGITLQAKLDGELPITLAAGDAEIKNGRLFSKGDAKLKIDNNEAFDNLKQQQAELGQVLSLLEELDIKSLSSDVMLAKDGWLDMAIAILGTNPTQQQDVNFNYTHKENIYTLMKALRMGDVIKDKVEKELQ